MLASLLQARLNSRRGPSGPWLFTSSLLQLGGEIRWMWEVDDGEYTSRFFEVPDQPLPTGLASPSL